MNELITPKKAKFISTFASAAFLILLIFLFFLQVVCGGKYSKLASYNSIRRIPLKAKRGLICDHRGEILVDSIPALYAAFIPEELKDKKNTLALLSRLLSLKEEEIAEQTNLAGRHFFEPVKVKELDKRDLAALAEHLLELPGVFIEEEPKRFYPGRDLAAHLVGYLGEISEKELKNSDYFGYRSGDLIGQTGIEKSMEAYLKGKDGGKQVLVDARGRFVKTLGSKLPYPGNRVYLTIDKKIQEIAEEALGEKTGIVIVSDTRTGGILAMVSHPAFDPNIFVNPLRPKDLARLYRRPKSPFLNRTIQCAYPPGSIFKIITAIAALEKKLISTRKKLNCTGVYKLGKKTFHCWKEKGHGPVSLLPAIEQSCNIYFYQLAEKMDVDDLCFYGRCFGLAQPTGINLPYEQKGFLPSRRWKKEKYNVDWYKGETLNLSIGQGYISVTPIQILNLISIVANEGVVYQPQLIKKISTPEGKVIKTFKAKQIRTVNLKPQTWRLLKEGLRQVVNGKKGTGILAMLDNVQVAGKTGTAQVIKKKKYEGRRDIPYRFRNHAWFAGFAPFSDPEIAIVVFVEHGGQGGVDAAPIAGRIFEQIFVPLEKVSPEGDHV